MRTCDLGIMGLMQLFLLSLVEENMRFKALRPDVAIPDLLHSFSSSFSEGKPAISSTMSVISFSGGKPAI